MAADRGGPGADEDEEAPIEVLLDTNVLLTATDAGREHHARALSILDEWPAAGVTLCASGQVLREYLVVATRAVDANGLGLPVADALANLDAFRSRVRLLPEDRAVVDRLREVVLQTGCAGRQVHDANIVATMLAGGVSRLITADAAVYRRFSRSVDITPLADARRRPSRRA